MEPPLHACHMPHEHKNTYKVCGGDEDGIGVAGVQTAHTAPSAAGPAAATGWLFAGRNKNIVQVKIKHRDSRFSHRGVKVNCPVGAEAGSFLNHSVKWKVKLQFNSIKRL